MQHIILASSSIYRRQLLDKLGINYQWAAPDIDETPSINEPPAELVQRLSLRKATALSHLYPSALIIGSDQVAAIDHQILGKPGNHANAQLRQASGRQVTFYTGLTLFHSATQTSETSYEVYQVAMRPRCGGETGN